MFEHVEHWRPALTKVCRALRPGGILFFISTNKFSSISGEHWFPLYGWFPGSMRYKLRQVFDGPEIMKLGIDFNQFRYPMLRRAMRDAGFTRVYGRTPVSDA